jgi:hypothetical protein
MRKKEIFYCLFDCKALLRILIQIPGPIRIQIAVSGTTKRPMQNTNCKPEAEILDLIGTKILKNYAKFQQPHIHLCANCTYVLAVVDLIPEKSLYSTKNQMRM